MIPFPITNGTYEVKPGLRKLGADERVFEVRENFDDQIAAKWRLQRHRNPVYVDKEVNLFDVDDMLVQAGMRFHQDYPNKKLKMGTRLGMQVQEDLALVQEKDCKVIYLHVSFPNGWNPAEKIGGTFAAVHAPVAHFEKMAAAQDKIVQAMIHHGPFERFAWGLHTIPDLDRVGKPDDWSCLDNLYFRVERQTTLGFPEHGAALFTIHTYVEPVTSLSEDQRKQLALALESMDERSRTYKGLTVDVVKRLADVLAR